MPWSKDNLPDAIKNKHYSNHQLDIFIASANAALKEYNDDGKAIATGINSADKIDNSTPEVKATFKKIAFIEAGVCGYPEFGSNILIKKSVLDNMIDSMRGSPIIIEHNNKIDSDQVHGHVQRVFYNNIDGQYYAEFDIDTLEGKNAIEEYKFGSCSYKPIFSGQGGIHNGIPYDDEVLGGEFTHLALVKNPRYKNAKILNNSFNKEKKQMPDLDKGILDKITDLFNSRFPQKTIAKDDHIVMINGKEITIAQLANTYKDSKKDDSKLDKDDSKLDKEDIKEDKEVIKEDKKTDKEDKKVDKEDKKVDKDCSNSLDEMFLPAKKVQEEIKTNHFNELNNAFMMGGNQKLDNMNKWLSEAQRVQLGKDLGI